MIDLLFLIAEIIFIERKNKTDRREELQNGIDDYELIRIDCLESVKRIEINIFERIVVYLIQRKRKKDE